MTILRSLVLAIALLTISTVTSANDRTVTDVLGRTVTIPDDAERILLGFYFEDFYAVGGPEAYDRVAAISRDAWEGWRPLQWKAYSEHQPELLELIDIGEVESGSFSLEAALAARPDLAILAAWQVAALGETVARLEAAGVPVVTLDYNAQSVDLHVASTRLLGQILGQDTRAEQLAQEYSGAVAEIAERLATTQAEPPRVYVELARKGPEEVDNSYGDTMWGRLIETAGGRNIAAGQVAKWGPLSPEFVLAENPQVILLAGSGWKGRDQAVRMGPGVDPATTHARMRAYLDRPGWSDLDAARDGRVHALYHGGARTLYDYAFLQYLAKALYPEAFADIDPEANLDRFFATYMPIRFDGSYMTQLPSP